MLLRRKQRRQFLDILSGNTNLKANHGVNNVLEVFSFRCRFPHVDNNRKSKVSAFFPKQNKTNTLNSQKLAYTEHLITICKKTPFSHLLCDLPNFRSTDRIHRAHCRTVHSTDRLCRLRGKMDRNQNPKTFKTKDPKRNDRH